MTRAATNGLAAKVARHFSEPEWFTTFEFPLYGAIETPDGKDRTIDALAVSRIAGRGNEVHGVEIKSARSDWLKELNTPSKAEAWTQLLDRFWLAAGKGVATPEEVPSTWGFLEEQGSGLRVVRRAPHLVATKRLRGAGGDPIPREVWVRVLRRTLDRAGIHPLLSAQYSKGHAAGVASVNENAHREADNTKWKLDRIETAVKEFEAASGVRIDDWGGEHLGKAVKVVLEHADVVRTFGSHLESFERNARDLRKALEEAGWKPPEPEADL